MNVRIRTTSFNDDSPINRTIFCACGTRFRGRCHLLTGRETYYVVDRNCPICSNLIVQKVECDPDPITSFKGSFFFLSNFYQATVTLDGARHPTVEHAYQAAKTMDKKTRREIRTTNKPAVAKRLGRRIRPLRPDWDAIKLDVMADLVTQKFVKHPDLLRKLLETGERPLLEVNNWGDRYWGIHKGKGQNWLGKILMSIRTDLASRSLDKLDAKGG